MMSVFKSAVFAGICVGIAGMGFLAGKELGMILFIFGLSAVVSYKLKLYTGTAGFVVSASDMKGLGIILLGNIVGCFIVSLIARCSPLPVQQNAESILQARLAVGWWKAGILSVGCGVLMSAAVTFARKGKEFGYWIPLIFAVPLFIHCGFPHCIADAFYYLACPVDFLSANAASIALLYVSIVFGNFCGCNLYRLFVKLADL